MWENAKTILLVSVVTILIWVFAESETLRNESQETTLIFEADPSTGRVLDLLREDGSVVEQGEIRVRVAAEGSPVALDKFKQELRDNRISITPGSPGLGVEPGGRDVRLVELLAEHPKIRSLGVTIFGTEPQYVRIRPDELVQRVMRVDVRIPDGETSALPQANPADVTVTMRRSQAEALGESPVAVARIDLQTWSKLIPGKSETVKSVRLELPAPVATLPYVSARPASVDVILTVKNKTELFTIPSVPISIRLAPAEINDWVIEVPENDRFLYDVRVTGPAEYIAALGNQSVKLSPVVSISFEELERKIDSKEAVFMDVPPGVKIDVTNKVVQFKISKRDATSTPPGSPPRKP